jgi:hypothetical protein
MAQKRVKQVRIVLDKVERKILGEVQEQSLDHEGLEPTQIAHLELKYRLFELRRKLRGIKGALYRLVRGFVSPHVVIL